jgi:hypothetical protein
MSYKINGIENFIKNDQELILPIEKEVGVDKITYKATMDILSCYEDKVKNCLIRFVDMLKEQSHIYENRTYGKMVEAVDVEDIERTLNNLIGAKK